MVNWYQTHDKIVEEIEDYIGIKKDNTSDNPLGEYLVKKISESGRPLEIINTGALSNEILPKYESKELTDNDFLAFGNGKLNKIGEIHPKDIDGIIVFYNGVVYLTNKGSSFIELKQIIGKQSVRNTLDPLLVK